MQPEPPSEDDEETMFRFFIELNKVADNPRSLVLLTSGFVELLVETLVEHHCKNGKRITNDSRSYPLSVKLVLLNESGILADDTFAHIETLRKIRNRAAHEAFFRITAKDLASLAHHDSHEGDLYLHCSNVIGFFWNRHIDTFAPVFAPKAYAASKEPKPASSTPSTPS